MYNLLFRYRSTFHETFDFKRVNLPQETRLKLMKLYACISLAVACEQLFIKVVTLYTYHVMSVRL